MHPHDHDRGLAFDLATLRSRRQALLLFGGAGLATLAACTTTPDATDGASATTTTEPADTCAPIPEETAGPFPGDGSNGRNILTESGIVRRDVRSSFGSASGTARGVPLTVELTVTDASSGCSALAGAAVYVWHCDAEGNYSMYSDAAAGENYLRGVQEADDDGRITFTSIFPGAYPGRWPHIHFQVYPSLAEATAAGEETRTSQLALPADVCEAVYATDGYPGSARNLRQTWMERDNVFSDDGGRSQLATVTGNASSGYTAGLTLAV